MSLLISPRHLLFPNPIVRFDLPSLIRVLVPVTYILSCIFFRSKIKGQKVGGSAGSKVSMWTGFSGRQIGS